MKRYKNRAQNIQYNIGDCSIYASLF